MMDKKTRILFESTLLLSETPKFTIFPRFKDIFRKHGDTRAIEETLNSLETLKDAKGEVLWEKRTTVWRVIRRALNIYFDFGSVIVLPYLILIFPIINLMVIRLIKYALEVNEVNDAINEATSVLKKLKEAEQTVKDPKAKAKIHSDIKKLEKVIKMAKEK